MRYLLVLALLCLAAPASGQIFVDGWETGNPHYRYGYQPYYYAPRPVYRPYYGGYSRGLNRWDAMRIQWAIEDNTNAIRWGR